MSWLIDGKQRKANLVDSMQQQYYLRCWDTNPDLLLSCFIILYVSQGPFVSRVTGKDTLFIPVSRQALSIPNFSSFFKKRMMHFFV